METTTKEFNRTVFLRYPDKVIKREYKTYSDFFYYDKNGYVKKVQIENTACKLYEQSLLSSGYKIK